MYNEQDISPGMFLELAVLERGFRSNHEWAVAWVDSGAPLMGSLLANIIWRSTQA